MSKYLVDTTVIIDHLRGNKKATTLLGKFNPYISVVTIAEVIQGSKDKREQGIAIRVCTSFPQFNIDKKICDSAVGLMEEFYLSHGLKFLDALIAATALDSKLMLITGNLKHFKFIKELKVISQKEALRFSRN